MEVANRRLIRPSLDELKQKMEAKRHHAAPPPQKKSGPPEVTNAENFYFAKQIQMKTPMVIVLRDGETIHGTVEWYDKAAIRVQRPEAPAVMIYKPAIKFLYKDE